MYKTIHVTFTIIVIKTHLIHNFLWILHIASSTQMTLLKQNYINDVTSVFNGKYHLRAVNPSPIRLVFL